MKKVTIEEHFFTEAHLDYLRSRKEYPRLETTEDEEHRKVERMWRSPFNYMDMDPRQISKLLDTGLGRIKEMDKAGIDMQVLSLAGPGIEDIDVSDGTTMAKKINEELAKVIKTYPERFAGFATLALKDPRGASDELERAVKELGLKGAKINSHVGGEYLDDKKYWAIFERAEKLGVPIYLHPKEPPPDMLKPFTAYPGLATAMWGFAADAGLHAMRLICSGVFDAYPGLKIILGHLGEAIPFWLWRINNHLRGPLSKQLKRKAGDYIKDNFFVTTSGMFWQPAFLCAYLALGADKILLAVDYPFEANEEALKFMEEAPICDSDKEKICHLNVEKLLAL